MDIHGPWVERVYTWPDGKERAQCVATLNFNRDYQAFEAMASDSGEWAVAPHRGIPAEPCHEWKRHLADDYRYGVTHHRRMFKQYGIELPEPFDWQTCWREEQWRENQYGGCFGHSWLTTDEVEQAQGRYLAIHEDWRKRDPETFGDREITPYPGFAVALAVMREAEAAYGQPCRLVFCFDV